MAQKKISTTWLGLIMMEVSDYTGTSKDTTNDESVSCSYFSSWTVVKSIPDDICSVLPGNTIEGGFCGPNSICSTFDGSISRL